MPAAGLAAAITDQFPEQFGGAEMPEKMPATGLGGAESGTIPYLWIFAGLMLAALTTTMAVRTRKQ